MPTEPRHRVDRDDRDDHVDPDDLDEADVSYSTSPTDGGVTAEITVGDDVAVALDGTPAAVVDALLGAAEQLTRQHPQLGSVSDRVASRRALEDAADAAEGMAAGDRDARAHDG